MGHVSRAPGASAPGAMAARAPATIAPTAGSPPANDRCLLGVSPLVYGASCVPPGASRGRWVSRAAPVSGGAGGSAMPLSPTRQLVTSRERSKPNTLLPWFVAAHGAQLVVKILNAREGKTRASTTPAVVVLRGSWPAAQGAACRRRVRPARLLPKNFSHFEVECSISRGSESIGRVSKVEMTTPMALI